ncbi:hypothetical protein JCM21900_006726 [Sporobolomyces salmonicolor]
MAAAPASSPVLLGSSSVPYSPLSAAPSALLCNADGQYAVVTRGEIHLLTPELPNVPSGASDDPVGKRQEAAVKGKGKGKEKGKEREPVQLRFAKTVIEVEKKNVLRWGDWADEPDLAAMGAIEPFWRAAAWSPSGLTTLGGCVLATLTTNSEVIFFEPAKNAFKGEWEETFDLTSTLVESIANARAPKAIEQTPDMRREMVGLITKCQTNSLAWSLAVPGSTSDLSLLALGHRSGEVSMWRYGPDRTATLVQRFRPGERANWITLLTWSSWTVGASIASACLAIGDADGRVWSIEISQGVSTTDDDSAASISVSKCLLIGESDRRAPTHFKKQRQLVYTKLGTANIATVQPNANDAKWVVLKQDEVELQTGEADVWVGVTPWAACSGLHYTPSTDSVLLVLSSTLFYRLPLASPPPTAAASPSLTCAARQLFIEVMTGLRSSTRQDRHKGADVGSGTAGVGRREGCRVLGMVGFEGGKGGRVAYVYETDRPDSLSYRTLSTIKTYLSVAELEGEPTPAEMLQNLDELLSSPSNAQTLSPLVRLRPLLQYVLNHADDAGFVSPLLDKLAPVALTPSAAAKGSNVRERFLGSVFGEEAFERLRCKEIVARVLARQPHLPADCQHQAFVTQLSLSRQLIKEVLTRTAAILGSSPELSGPSRALTSRLLLAASNLLPGLDPASIGTSQPLFPADALASAFEADEACPACRAPVPLANVRFACCEAGHRWERCSITLAIVSTVNVRTCTSCERKALLGLPSNSSKEGEGEREAAAVSEVLAAATCCLYCGGRWMKVR